MDINLATTLILILNFIYLHLRKYPLNFYSSQFFEIISEPESYSCHTTVSECLCRLGGRGDEKMEREREKERDQSV